MRIVSLFSGAGGLDLGLIRAGHQIVWANDNDKDAVDTYRQNIGDHVILGDITQQPSNSIPECDVVVGGFPCQGFSLANMRRHGKDDRNRLYLEFLRIVRDKKPLYFLAENVRGILSLEGGAALKKIVSDFTKAGYRVKVQQFNAADFGVPQSRVRVIIAGTRKDLPVTSDFQYPSPTHNRLGAYGLKKWMSIGEAVASIPDPDRYPTSLPNQHYSKYKVTNRNFTGHRTTDPAKPSPTILARGNGKGGVCAIQHPENTRRLSVRESAAVQSFPLDFAFAGAMNSAYRQVGNAVAVDFALALGHALKAAELLSMEQSLRLNRRVA
jgi:DNA (cytosine-5)-methyltransferase 1